VVRCVNLLNLEQLPLELVELLQRMVPTEAETKLYRQYEAERKDVAALTDEDQYLVQLSRVERLANKLTVMAYMGNFFDNVHLVQPQIHAVISASNSIGASKRLRRVLEVILAFGNYMNSAKRGPAYGFRLQSLDNLTDTKSTDKRRCLLHYIAQTIHDRVPEAVGVESELRFVEKAAQVSLENVLTDIAELEKGMEAAKREMYVRQNVKDETMKVPLRDFLANSDDKLRRLRAESKSAQEAYSRAVEFFGESSRTIAANVFFAIFARFLKALKVAEQENEHRRKMERAAEAAAASKHHNNNLAVSKRNKINAKKQQAEVIQELKSKSSRGPGGVQEKKLLDQEEVYHGALEDILLGLKNEPYRRADAVRRSQRKRTETARLSRALDDLDV